MGDALFLTILFFIFLIPFSSWVSNGPSYFYIDNRQETCYILGVSFQVELRQANLCMWVANVYMRDVERALGCFYFCYNAVFWFGMFLYTVFFFILFIDNMNANKIYYKWFNLFLWFQTYYVLGLVVAHNTRPIFLLHYCEFMI